MSDTLKLHVLPGSPRSLTVMLLLDVLKMPYELQMHNRESLKTDEFRKVCPYGMSPAIETKEGPIFESMAIARWATRQAKKLNGANDWEATQVDQWACFVRNHIYPAMAKFVYGIFAIPGFYENDIGAFKKAVNDFLTLAKRLDEQVKDRKYLVGDPLSLADVVLVGELNYVMRYTLTTKDRQRIPNLTAYFTNLVNSGELGNLLPKFEVGKEAFKVYNTPKVAKKQRKGSDSSSSSEEDKKKKKKKNKNKKEQKKAPAKKVEPAKPKKPSFPDTKFDLFAFKTFFVNEKDDEKRMKFVFDNFDENALSFWELNYDKLEGECEQLYMTTNLMNGFVSRSEHMRKYVFGSQAVYGEEGNYNIRGCWLSRGTEELALINDHFQNDVYKYKKLDPKNAEDRALIVDYWTKQEEDKDVVKGEVLRVFTYVK